MRPGRGCQAVTDLYTLPEAAVLGGKSYPHRTAWQDMLKLLRLLADEEKPAFLRWQIALAYFYLQPVPEECTAQAAEYLSAFLTAGQSAVPGPKLFDWEQDAAAIIADVNAAAGREVRSERAHFWTFLSWFHSIREGQLSNLITIRDKLRRGKKLEPYEQEFYRTHRDQVVLRRPMTAREEAEKQRLNQMLSGQ